MSRSIVRLLAPLLCVISTWMPAGADTELDGRSPGIDELLGGNRRAELADRLATLELGGKRHPWRAYANWGRELFFQGQVLESPLASGPSPPISSLYRCADCHNHQREDPDLVQQDPEARLAWIRRPRQAPPGERPNLMAAGTTLWGAVNRESFYNGVYAVYRSLPVPGGQAMDPTRLEDAIQVCCSYCSVGRFAEPWEMASLLAYLGELEVRVDDLDLPAAVRRSILQSLEDPASGDAEVARTRGLLGRLYLRRAGATYTHPPAVSRAGVGPYPDEIEFRGDVAEGRVLYEAACRHCHGAGKVNENEGAGLVADLGRFHEVLAFGTERDREPYMPRFTAQRLSRQQIIDIQTYLLSLD